MKIGLAALVLGMVSLHAEDVWLSCKVIEFVALETEGQVDAKLKKLEKFIAKSDALAKYKSFKFAAKKNVNATTSKAGKIKLKNGANLSITAVSVDRAHKKNTITLEVAIADGNAERASFVDREYLFRSAGAYKKSGELIAAISCPVFP